MNIKPSDKSNQSISDDQELAKVLAGVNQAADDSTSTDTAGGDAAVPTPPMPPMPEAPAAPAADGEADSTLPAPQAAGDDATMPTPPTPMPDAPAQPAAPASTSASPELDAIKQQALGELRPLVDKLDVSPEEKFDTYLLLLRSTDDKELIAPAHEAAKSIEDEARRAQALLDIIKEIDFLSKPQTT